MDPYQAAVVGKIRDRLAYRRWYRAHRWPRFDDLLRENDAALHELLAVARTARRMTPRPNDPVDIAKAVADWEETEKAIGWGRG